MIITISRRIAYCFRIESPASRCLFTTRSFRAVVKIPIDERRARSANTYTTLNASIEFPLYRVQTIAQQTAAANTNRNRKMGKWLMDWSVVQIDSFRVRILYSIGWINSWRIRPFNHFPFVPSAKMCVPNGKRSLKFTQCKFTRACDGSPRIKWNTEAMTDFYSPVFPLLSLDSCPRWLRDCNLSVRPWILSTKLLRVSDCGVTWCVDGVMVVVGGGTVRSTILFMFGIEP